MSLIGGTFLFTPIVMVSQLGNLAQSNCNKFSPLNVLLRRFGRPITFPQRSDDGFLEGNPLDFIKSNLVIAPVIESGSPGRLMPSHLLGNL